MKIILTDVGEQLASEGFLTGVFPKITKVWFGDGNGSVVIPTTSMTSLTNMIYEGVGTVIARFNTPNRLYIYTQIPASVGDITVREIGLLTEDNTLIAIGGELEKYKPSVSESLEKMDFYITLPISSTQEITVEFSNTNLYASQEALDIVANAGENNRLYINRLLPRGMIMFWSGLISTIPNGWYLCDGSNGTPDLRNKFVYGASTDNNVGLTGGSKDAVVVSHNHSASSDSQGNHAHTGWTDAQGSHAHALNTEGVAGGIVGVNQGGLHQGYGKISSATTSDGAHGHNVGMNGAGVHAHNITVNSNGVSGTDKNLPPYMILAYIMKG